MRLNIKAIAAASCKALAAITLIMMAMPVGRMMGARMHIYVACAQVALVLFAAIISGDRKTKMHRCVAWIFIIYAAHLASVLFLDRAFGRELSFNWESIRNLEAINLRPLFTINTYIARMKEGSIGMGVLVINLFGNAIALAPMGVFLPIVFKKMRRIWPSLAAGALVIILIEIIQRVTGTGSLDIDDFILNFLGFTIVRLIMELPKIKRVYLKLI